MEIMWLSEFTTHPQYPQRSSYMHRKTNTFLSPNKSTKFTHPPKKSSFHHFHLLLQVTYLSTEKHHFATISPSHIVRNPQLHSIKYCLVQDRISITDDANFRIDWTVYLAFYPRSDMGYNPSFLVVTENHHFQSENHHTIASCKQIIGGQHPLLPFSHIFTA